MLDRDDPELLTEEKWQAIVRNDESHDFKFFYAVTSTGIFCRPSCKSKVPNRDNVRIFRNAEQAMREEFRPCKRCKPTGERLPDREWVGIMTDYMDKNFAEPITLTDLAEVCHGSPYHLHRTFKRIMDMTPAEYLQNIRIEKAQDYLRNTSKSAREIGSLVGFQHTSYFITVFKRRTGCTPAEYRQQRIDGR
ncbi:bifunctional transcriptional activator/DNA repair enzyme AdaA [Paenibacillus sp. KQZ6P-2]|uniref:Bifunctional transcriptional activator/DNA repair enzyme AdaA n=1 Tax=Paenibacillus mangrovi TaxID=2931978 RepID=A0A9X1WZ72_9BACL|nr:bifunctional transcriptional activator/DNA repair enzyme AdaA [Paenibacillus mangrovi]MCJ8014899.1 bifunctional transcriptional activator/DNA repair enzyme AdaA [Paenibacillus mangrovi]